MKKSEIALIAAQTIAAQANILTSGMCTAVMEVSCAPVEQRLGLLVEIELFEPVRYPPGMWWGWDWEDKNSTAKECRVLALCFLSAMLESKGN
jgi:hypothetical protein